jgi:hypothetical protein
MADASATQKLLSMNLVRSSFFCFAALVITANAPDRFGFIQPLRLAEAQTTQTGTCLPISAKPTEQLARALADVTYASCLKALAKQQANGCDQPTDAAGAPAYLACLQNTHCDSACARRAQAFWDLALATEDYHAWRKACDDRGTQQACSDRDAREQQMRKTARNLVGSGSNTF